MGITTTINFCFYYLDSGVFVRNISIDSLYFTTAYIQVINASRI